MESTLKISKDDVIAWLREVADSDDHVKEKRDRLHIVSIFAYQVGLFSKEDRRYWEQQSLQLQDDTGNSK